MAVEVHVGEKHGYGHEAADLRDDARVVRRGDRGGHGHVIERSVHKREDGHVRQRHDEARPGACARTLPFLRGDVRGNGVDGWYLDLPFCLPSSLRFRMRVPCRPPLCAFHIEGTCRPELDEQGA